MTGGLVGEVGRLSSAFLGWWFSELRDLLPPRLRSLSAVQSKRGLVLELRADEAVLIEQNGPASFKELLRVDKAAEEASVFTPFLTHRRSTLPIRVQLDQRLGLRKIVDLPLAAKNDLGPLLRFELDRLTPFSTEDVSFAWQITDIDPQAAQMSVELQLAPNAVLKRATDLLAGSETRLEGIMLESGPGENTLDLRPQAIHAENESHWPNRILPALAACLALIVLAIPIYKQERLIGELKRDVVIAQKKAEESLALREQLDDFTHAAGLLVEMKNNRPTASEILAELTHLLPDQAYLRRFEVGEGGVKIGGEADKASDLIAILDRSALLHSPTFRSPVTRDDRSGKERFLISLSPSEEPL